MAEIPGSVHGACSRRQALAALGRYGLRLAVSHGQLTPIWRGVLVDPRRTLDLRSRAAAALITVGTGGVLSGPTALALHGCTAATESAVHVTIGYDRSVRRRSGLVVHQGRLAPSDVVELDGLPAMALDLATAEVLCTAPRASALAIADQATGLCPREEQAEFLESVVGRLDRRVDRRGTRRAALLLRLVDAAAESPPESYLRLLVVDSGFPIPVAQYELCDLGGVVLCRFDLAWPQARIALEYDGYEAHVDRAQLDAARDEDTARRGWLTIRATVADLQNPRRLLDELAGAFGRRRTHIGRAGAPALSGAGVRNG